MEEKLTEMRQVHDHRDFKITLLVTDRKTS